MLRIIVDNYPIRSSRVARIWWSPASIRHIPPQRLIGAQKWNRYKFIIMGEQFTLSEIQQNFLLDEFNQPLALLALTQASISGPPLRNEPYYGCKLRQQLNDQAKKFLSQSGNFRIDRKAVIVYLSAFLQPSWHGKDFLGEYSTTKRFKNHPPALRAVLNLISEYIPQIDASYLETADYDVKYINYDWRLNE